METLCEVELNGLPPTVNHLYRTGRSGHRYKTAMGKLYQDYVSVILRQRWNGRPKYTGNVEVRIEFITKSHRRWDIDNRVKALQDCLNIGGILKDYSQVQVLHVERVYGQKERTRLKIIGL